MREGEEPTGHTVARMSDHPELAPLHEKQSDTDKEFCLRMQPTATDTQKLASSETAHSPEFVTHAPLSGAAGKTGHVHTTRSKEKPCGDNAS